MKSPSENKSAVSPIIIIPAGLFIVGFIGVTDFITGSEISFSIFYLLPVLFVTYFSGRAAGIAVSFASAATWFTADMEGGAVYSHVLIPYWNATVRLGYFILVCLLAYRLLQNLERERQLARYDSLTEAANSRFFYEYSDVELKKAYRSKKPLSIVYIDLDNFKVANDAFGHATGDQILWRISSIVRSDIRPGDMFARLGGDEFAILMPETGYEECAAVLERIRVKCLEEMKRNNWPVTLSVGAVSFAIPPATVDALLHQADGLMYSAKTGGKNAVVHEKA